jgi:hypothetical protein
LILDVIKIVTETASQIVNVKNVESKSAKGSVKNQKIIAKEKLAIGAEQKR